MRTNERRWWWIFIQTTMMLQFQMKGSEGCLETERAGLLQLQSYLKNLLDEGEEDSILKSWTRNGDCCIWERVKCNDANGGHVVDLSLARLIPVAFESETRALNLSSAPKPLTFLGTGSPVCLITSMVTSYNNRNFLIFLTSVNQ